MRQGLSLIHICSDNRRRHDLAIVQGHGNLCSVLDDMVVRDDIAVGRDKESRALRLGHMRLDVMAAFLAEMLEEALERITGCNMRRLEFVFRIRRLGGLHLDGHDRTADVVDNIGEGDRRDSCLLYTSRCV